MVNPQRLLQLGTALYRARPPVLLPRPNALGREENPQGLGAGGLQLTFSGLDVNWRSRVLSPQFVVKRGDHALPPMLQRGGPCVLALTNRGQSTHAAAALGTRLPLPTKIHPIDGQWSGALPLHS